MSFRSVYRSLHEVFPQVDLRILKAVAIEHSTDVDAAVEFIISEVLPSLSVQEAESYPNTSTCEEPPEGEKYTLDFTCTPGKDEVKSSVFSCQAELLDKSPANEYTSVVHANLSTVDMHTPSIGPVYESEATIISLGHQISDQELNPRAVTCHAGLIEVSLGSDETGTLVHSTLSTQDECNLSVGSVVDPRETVIPLEYQQTLFDATADNQQTLDGATADKFIETTSLPSENALINSVTENYSSASHSGELIVMLPSVLQDTNGQYSSIHHEEIMPPYEAHRANECSFSESRLGPYEDHIMDWGSPLLSDTQGELGLHSELSNSLQSISDSFPEDNGRSSVAGKLAEEALSASLCGEEAFFSVKPASESLSLEGECVHDDPVMSNSLSSRHVVNTDFLEEFVADCKGIKNTLVSAMESVVDMMKEVDVSENEARLAKEAASISGLDILEKVEDLKEMLKHAKEANNMHAGEVYGEKSILATEARELQARLLSLSDQRHKSLAIIEEINQKLKARLVSAEEERVKAEQEKLEKKEAACKALTEQEEIMEKVVQESKQLQRETEENSKLREFLMERGRLVDTLQGEISVICEDIAALKDQVDGRLPLGKKLPSSQILSSLASSNSSRASASSDKVACSVGPVTMNSIKTLKSQQNTDTSEKLAVPGSDPSSFSDDEWEYFDGETELSRC